MIVSTSKGAVFDTSSTKLQAKNLYTFKGNTISHMLGMYTLDECVFDDIFTINIPLIYVLSL